MHMHDLVPYLKDGEVHHWGHTVHRLSFESAMEEYKVDKKEEMLKKLGMVVQPLDYHFAHVRVIFRRLYHSRLTLNKTQAQNQQYMFQYFLKVVGTRYHFLDENFVRLHYLFFTVSHSRVFPRFKHINTV